MSDKQDTREMLVSGNVFKTMLTLSVPAVLGMVVIGRGFSSGPCKTAGPLPAACCDFATRSRSWSSGRFLCAVSN